MAEKTVNTPAAPTAPVAPTSAVSSDKGTAPVAPASVTPRAGAQPSAATPTAPAVWDYKTDPRWGKDPNGTPEQNKGKIWASETDIIQGYKSLDDILETKYKPVFQKYSDIEKVLKDNSLEITQLPEYIKNYNELINPENSKNQTWEFLNSLVDDDVTAQEFQLALKKLQEEKLNRRFPNMSQEQREQAIVQERKLAELESKLSGFEKSQMKAANLEIIKSNESSIKQLCADKGFEFTDNIKKEFWTYCSEQVKAGKMTLEQMPYVFIMKYGKELDSAFENKIKAFTMNTQKDAQTKTVTFTKKPFEPSKEKPKFADRLRKIYNEINAPPAAPTA